MRIHLIKKQTIENYIIGNSQSKSGFTTWLAIIKQANWEIPNDIVITYGSADILGNGIDRVVFNIGGNKYRMICKYYFGEVTVHLFIMWIGTHTEYTELCKKGEQYTVSVY